MEKVVSVTCRSYNCKRYKCDEKGCEKRRVRTPAVAGFLEPFLIKNRFKNSSKKRSPKNMEFDAKGIPKWSQIDTKSNQKSMPNLVTKKIRKIIKNHVSLNSKISEIQ